ncbi:MAG: hypothetical protein K0S20_486 [Patescibacteria group bacterium]|jgi:hypothetical protein|nr:hypothetical protein [Patescibacteria group bacterium]
MAKPRLFLFYGTDSRSSGQAVRKWESLFIAKYGDATRHILDADNLSQNDLAKTLRELVEGQSLFPTPKLILVKRLSSTDRAPGFKTSKTFVLAMNEIISYLDESVTIAVWEDRSFAATHPLLKAFEEWEKQGIASTKRFQAPLESQVVSVASKYVAAQGGSLDKSGAAWLQSAYGNLGKRARLEKRLKTGQDLLEDERPWWLYQLLDNALIRTNGQAITEAVFRADFPEAITAVGVFDIVTAISNGRFQSAHELLEEVDPTDDSIFFSLIAALRWQFGKSPSRTIRSGYALSLLAEMELIIKNFPIPFKWLLSLFIKRLEQHSRSGEELPILNARKLWLAHLART